MFPDISSLLCTLGARDLSSTVSGFCQVIIVTHAKSFFSRFRRSWLRPTAKDVLAFGQHRKFPPHVGKTSGTQGICYEELTLTSVVDSLINRHYWGTLLRYAIMHYSCQLKCFQTV